MWLIGRQPILDRDERITAYELLFRAPGDERAIITDPVAATANVILGALSGFGVEQVLGGHQGFVNVDEELLFDDSLELLPHESVVLELLESIRPTAAVVQRCEQLRSRSWKLALDDHVYAPEFEPLYPLVDVVKIDLNVTPLVAAALLRREGPFGELLSFVERMERPEVDEALAQVTALQMTREQVLEEQGKAFAWQGTVS